MGWSKRQIQIAAMAARAAGWSDAQRRIALRGAGCPVGAGGAVSSRDPRNRQDHYELYMAIAEAAAAQRGESVAPPAGARSWRTLTSASAARMRWRIRGVAHDAQLRRPDVFRPGFLRGFVRRMTERDAPPAGAATDDLDRCNECQVYRILEGLKAWTARECRAASRTKEAV